MFETEGPVYRGLSFSNVAERDAEAREILGKKEYAVRDWLDSATVNPDSAKRFANLKGPGIIIKIQKPGGEFGKWKVKTCRDLRDMVRMLVPRYRYQDEVMLLRASRYKLAAEPHEIALPRGRTPVFTVEEV